MEKANPPSKRNSTLVWDDRNANIQLEKRANILSICTIPQYRGQGISTEMIRRFQDILKLNGRIVCFLTVEIDNKKAIRFYIKNKFQLYKELSGVSQTYMIDI